MVTVKARDGSMMNVKLADNARVMAFDKASPADIKTEFLHRRHGHAGSRTAPRKHSPSIFFLRRSAAPANGFRHWDLRPNSTMTNANVESKVASVDGDVVVVKYKDGEKKVIISKDTPVVAYAPGEMSEVKPGAQIIIFGCAETGRRHLHDAGHQYRPRCYAADVTRARFVSG